jgi:hypothetical protein
MFFATLVVGHEVAAVQPLDNTQEFMLGAFRMPSTPPTTGPVPARLEALPRDRCALPKGVWLRFQNFGAERYKDWSAQMQIDDQGNIFLITHLGDSTADKVKRPSWPDAPTQKLDAATLAQLRKDAAAFATGQPYRGHQGLPYAPTFVVTLHDKTDSEIILEGYEDAFISRLRTISQFALSTPLKADKAHPDKKPAKQPARKP